MTSYDQTIMKEYTFDAINLGAAFSRNIRGPKGRRGQVRRLALSVTTSIVGAPVLSVTTTVAPVPQIPSAAPGNASTVVLAYAIPATTAPAGLTSDTAAASTVRDANFFTQTVAADADVILSATTLATSGVADITCQIDWF